MTPQEKAIEEAKQKTATILSNNLGRHIEPRFAVDVMYMDADPTPHFRVFFEVPGDVLIQLNSAAGIVSHANEICVGFEVKLLPSASQRKAFE